MRLRVLVVPDKFKGTLTAQGAADAVARGWLEARPKDQLDLLPMSDGGDGFGEVMSGLLGAIPQSARTCDAAHRPCIARWWWNAANQTAIIETATVVGLAMLPHGQYHPFDLDTYGLGRVLLAAARKGAKRCLVGLGGSSTNDGGFGLARAVGWKFLCRSGASIERWTDLPRATRLRRPDSIGWPPLVLAAVDVQNPLLGPRGATRVYGPQKGLKPQDLPIAEHSLAHLASLVRGGQQCNFARTPGAGAAGGLGFGLLAFLGARTEPGFELFSREARLGERIARADLVITGEGSIDRSTFMGKGAGSVARLCFELGVPCIGLAGVVGRGLERRRLFRKLYSLAELTTITQAMIEPAKWLRSLAKRAGAECSKLVNQPTADPQLKA